LERFKSCSLVYCFEVFDVCLRMVRFRRLVRLGLRLLRFSLCLRRVRRLGIGIGVTMRSGLCCRESLDKTGFKPFML